jgi:hypothetical protein
MNYETDNVADLVSYLGPKYMSYMGEDATTGLVNYKGIEQPFFTRSLFFISREYRRPLIYV